MADITPLQSSLSAQAFMKRPLDLEIVNGIKGNAPPEVKQMPLKWLMLFRQRGNSFATSVAQRLRVTEVNILPSPDDSKKLEGKVVCEVDVTPDMCSARGVLHEGCIAFLVDECIASSMSVAISAEGRASSPGVTQTMNLMFHASANVGTKLRIVSTTMASGLQSNAGRCEVWDSKNHRLLASGAMLLMPPSLPMKRPS